LRERIEEFDGLERLVRRRHDNDRPVGAVVQTVFEQRRQHAWRGPMPGRQHPFGDLFLAGERGVLDLGHRLPDAVVRRLRRCGRRQENQRQRQPPGPPPAGHPHL
jgi:hypothetical protein